MKKILPFILVLTLGAVLLTGCASNASTMPSPTPGATNMLEPLMPESTNNGLALGTTPGTAATGMPAATGEPLANGQQPTVEGTRQAAQAMEEAVEKLSEVDDAYVVPLGDTALVGVKFTTQYQSGTDDRLKKMVLTRVQTVDKAVTKVAVTENAAIVAGIQAASEALKGASSLDDVNTKAEELLRQLTVYSE